MNLNRAQATQLAADVARQTSTTGRAELAVCPPFVYVDAVAAVLRGTSISLGAQDVYFEADGAFTGEISTAMLTDLGCRYVILGHSERRHVLHMLAEE